MYPFFICDHNLVASKLKHLTYTNISEDGYTEYYFDDHTNEEWAYNTYEPEWLKETIHVLKRLPEPTTEQLIDIAITSDNKYEIAGAAWELFERERHNKEDFRQQLMERLMQMDISNLSAFEKERVRIIIEESDLSIPT